MSEGVNEVPDENSKLLVDIQIQLARIEKTLESVPAMAATLEAVKEMARTADQSSKSAHHRLDALDGVKGLAEDAQRKATSALELLKAREDDMKWFKRTFYGAVIVAIGGSLVATIWAAIKIAGGQ